MFKKTVSIFLLLVLMAGGICLQSSEAALTESNQMITPLWTMIQQVSNYLEISSVGKATMVSQISGYKGQVDSIRITSSLQRYNNGSWDTVKSWAQDYEGSSAMWSNSWYVTKGYNYRLVSLFQVYGNGSHESTVLTSGVKYY